MPIPKRSHNAQGAGPEFRCKALRRIGPDNIALRRFDIGYMNDKRIKAWPALRLINRRNSRPVPRVSTQTVDRFGRKSDKTAGRKYACGVFNSVMIGRNGAGARRGNGYAPRAFSLGLYHTRGCSGLHPFGAKFVNPGKFGRAGVNPAPKRHRRS